MVEKKTVKASVNPTQPPMMKNLLNQVFQKGENEKKEEDTYHKKEKSFKETESKKQAKTSNHSLSQEDDNEVIIIDSALRELIELATQTMDKKPDYATIYVDQTVKRQLDLLRTLLPGKKVSLSALTSAILTQFVEKNRDYLVDALK